MAIFAHLDSQQFRADDMAVIELAASWANSLKDSIAVMRDGDDFTMVRYEERGEAKGTLWKVFYPSASSSD